MVLEGHLGFAADLAFNPDGTLLVTAGRDGTLRHWGVTAHESGEAAAPAPTGTGLACTVSASGNVNLRSGPGTIYSISGTMGGGQSRAVIGQMTGTDGFVWWQVQFGSWVCSDVVTTAGDCEPAPETEP